MKLKELQKIVEKIIEDAQNEILEQAMDNINLITMKGNTEAMINARNVLRQLRDKKKGIKINNE